MPRLKILSLSSRLSRCFKIELCSSWSNVHFGQVGDQTWFSVAWTQHRYRQVTENLRQMMDLLCLLHWSPDLRAQLRFSMTGPLQGSTVGAYELPRSIPTQSVLWLCTVWKTRTGKNHSSFPGKTFNTSWVPSQKSMSGLWFPQNGK